jgi:hypothetical protein
MLGIAPRVVTQTASAGRIDSRKALLQQKKTLCLRQSVQGHSGRDSTVIVMLATGQGNTDGAVNPALVGSAAGI